MSMPPRSGRLGYQPALDGVRAVAVLMVLCFHAGFGWIGGGYLGVSIFFTLSGFLITTLLLMESERTGRISFVGFYRRRLQRLLPASLLCLLLIVALCWLGEFRLVPNMRGQLVGAIGDFYNWTRIAGTSSYTQLFSQSPVLVSPVEHYWSLAIEEQFYLVWPPLVWVIVRAGRRPANVVYRLCLLTGVVAVASPLLSASAPNFAYWSTPTRLGELLVGAAAAAWHARGGRLPDWCRWLAIASMTALIVLAARLPVGSGPAYSGWMAPIALISAVLILSLQTQGAMRSLLSLAPLVWVGRLSYGIYLYHWPVFVLLRAHGWHLDRPRGLVVALAITTALATVSYFVVERPVRLATWAPRRTFGTAALAAAVALVAVIALPASRGFLQANESVLDAAAIQPADSLADLLPTPTSPSTTSPSTTSPLRIALPAVPSRPVRVLVVGDSTAWMVAQGLADFAVDHPQHAQVSLLWYPGLGFMLDGTIVSFESVAIVEQSAVVLHDDLPQRIRELKPDVVLLMSTIYDLGNREWNETEGPLTPYDAAFRERMVGWYQQITDDLVAMEVPTVVWVVPPTPHGEDLYAPEMGERARFEVQHEVIREVVENSTTNVRQGVQLVDLDSWLDRAGHAESDWWRPDKVHFSEESAHQLAVDYLGPWLIAAALGQ
ncbi:acyltransferase family protein [soil metagenome]